MNNYAYLVKAKAKSDSKSLFCWFSAKSDSRAEREILNKLDDADIEVGRGTDYQLPVRTNWLITDDLPEEGLLDDTWCDRYRLQEDGRTWLPNADVESTDTSDQTHSTTQNTTDEVKTDDGTVPVENRTQAVRFAIHLTSDKYQTHISKEQHIAASAMALDDEQVYLQSVLLAKNECPEINDLSLHAEWKLMQAIKAVFSPDSAHDPKAMTRFMADWIKTDPSERTLFVENWLNENPPAREADVISEGTDKANENVASSVQDRAFSHQQYSFEQRVLGTWLFGLFDELSDDQKLEISRLNMDMDATYPQNVLLACRNHDLRQLQHVFPETLLDLFTDVKSVWSAEGPAPQLGQLVSFFNEWISAHNSNSSITVKGRKIDRDGVTAKWLKKVGKPPIQRTDAGTSAGGGNATDRNPDIKHNLDSLDIEIAAALLPMDYNIYEIPGGVLRRAKEVITDKEEPWSSWSAQLRKTPGVLDFSRAAVFVLIRNAPECINKETPKLISYIAQNFKEVPFIPDTGNDDSEARWQAVERLLLPPAAAPVEGSASEEVDSQLADANHVMPKWLKNEEHQNSEEQGNKVHTLPKWAATADDQPKVESLGGGIFSLEGLTGNAPSNEVEKTENVSQEDISDVQMERVIDNENEVNSELPASQKANAPAEKDPTTGEKTNALNNDSGHHIVVAVEPDFSHLMIDLETMGKSAVAPIVSIGAVFFDPETGQMGAEFYQAVSLESSMSFGAVADASTILWWLKQPSEARAAIAHNDAPGLLETLELLSDFISENSANGGTGVQLWGNGSSFDNVILRSAFKMIDTPFSVPSWNDRDVRTLVEIGRSHGVDLKYDIPFEGDQHHALSDAKHQVKYVSAIWQLLKAN